MSGRTHVVVTQTSEENVAVASFYVGSHFCRSHKRRCILEVVVFDQLLGDLLLFYNCDENSDFCFKCLINKFEF